MYERCMTRGGGGQNGPKIGIKIFERSLIGHPLSATYLAVRVYEGDVDGDLPGRTCL